MMESHPHPPGESRNAPRYTIRTSLLYRERGEVNWHQGKIHNISRSGLLFQGEHLLKRKTAVELRFVLAVEAFGESAAEVICKGKIVRHLPPAGGGGAPHALAARIRSYCFVRAQAAFADSTGQSAAGA